MDDTTTVAVITRGPVGVSNEKALNDARRSRWARQGRARPMWPGFLCCGIYLLVAMVEFGHVGALGPGHLLGNGSMDAMEQIWWLAWTPFALAHGHNLFLPLWQNYPFGENFGVNGSMIALGIMLSPITELFGPVVSWNLGLSLAPAVSAASMCFVLRRWTAWWPAAFVGGLLYGFSSFAFNYANVGGGYLFVLFVPLPPLAFLLVHEILVRQQWRPVRTGTALGFVCVVQFFISSEILATTVMMGAIAAAVYLVSNHRHLRVKWRYAIVAIASSLGIACLFLCYPVAYTMFGPEHVNGVPTSGAALNAVPPDLGAAVVPISRWLNPNFVKMPGIGLSLAGTFYLGAPLIVAFVVIAVVFRKRGSILFASGMTVIAFVLSFGSHVVLYGHTSIALPFDLLERAPLIQGIQPPRLSLFTMLFGAATFALGMDELRIRLERRSTIASRSPRRRDTIVLGLTVLLTALVMVPLLPANVTPWTTTSSQTVPAFFRSTAVSSIPNGSAVLAYPYLDKENTGWVSAFNPGQSILLDQAITGMRFKVIGGYGWFPSASGHNGTTNPSALRPASIQALFNIEFSGGTSAERSLVANSNLRADLREFMLRYSVQTVVILPEGKPPGRLMSLMTSVIGPPLRSGGITIWLHVRQKLLAR